MSDTLQPGIVGLGKMGGDLALQCVDRGIYIVGHSKHDHPDLQVKGVRTTSDYRDLTRLLKAPRVIYISVPAGPPVDEVLGELVPILNRGDVIMDGGNSFYLDSIKRENDLRDKGSISWIAARAVASSAPGQAPALWSAAPGKASISRRQC